MAKHLIIATNAHDFVLRSINRRGWSAELPGVQFVLDDETVDKIVDQKYKAASVRLVSCYFNGNGLKGPSDAALEKLKCETIGLDDGFRWLKQETVNHE